MADTAQLFLGSLWSGAAPSPKGRVGPGRLRVGPRAQASANASFLPPLGSQPPGASPSLSYPSLHPLGAPHGPSGEPIFMTPYRSVTDSETDVLQRHVVDGGRARVPWCLDRSRETREAVGEGAEGEERPRWLPWGLTPSPCRPRREPCTCSHHPGGRQLLQI